MAVKALQDMHKDISLVHPIGIELEQVGKADGIQRIAKGHQVL